MAVVCVFTVRYLISISRVGFLIFYSIENRFELAQQLQPQTSEDPLESSTVAHDIQVEIESSDLQQASASSAEQQSILGLSQTEVVNGGMEASLGDQPLVQEEGRKDYCVGYDNHNPDVTALLETGIKMLTF